MFVITLRRPVHAILILSVLFFYSVPSFSSEKEIKIGIQYISNHNINLHFNVPLTEEMERVISKQEGVEFIAKYSGGKYKINVVIGEMFSPQEVIDNIIKALRIEVFKGKSVKAHPMK